MGPNGRVWLVLVTQYFPYDRSLGVSVKRVCRGLDVLECKVCLETQVLSIIPKNKRP